MQVHKTKKTREKTEKERDDVSVGFWVRWDVFEMRWLLFQSGEATNTLRICVTASAARAEISASESVLRGCVITTGSRVGAPRAARCTSASRTNAAVMMTAVGTPRVSSSTVSCRLHDVQEPQSPIAVTAMSFSATICSSSAAEAGREKLSFTYRCTVMVS